MGIKWSAAKAVQMARSWKRIAKTIILCLVAALILIAPVAAQSPDDQEGKFSDGEILGQMLVSPQPLHSGQESQAVLSITYQPDTECRGIPGKPLDVFFVVDNSLSAGNGINGTNLFETIQVLKSFLSQFEQVVYSDIDYNNPIGRHSRVGLVASRMEQKPVLYLNELSEDYQVVSQAIDNLAGGGDTELAEGINLAAQNLQENVRPGYQPAIILVVHDKDPLQVSRVQESIQTTEESKIPVYIISNSYGLSDYQVITPEDTESLVGVGQFYPDPIAQDIRKIFINLSGGTEEPVATSSYITVSWSPNLSVTSVQESGVQVANIAAWTGVSYAQNESIVLHHSITIPENFQEPYVSASINLIFIDCNGLLRNISQQKFSYPVEGLRQQEPTALPVKTLTGGEQQSAESTAAPAGAVAEPTAPVSLAVDTPTLPNLPDFDVLGPISQMLSWIGGLVLPGVAMPVISVAWDWVLLVLLILLLLFSLWLLYRWWKNRKRPSKLRPGGVSVDPPEPDPVVSPTEPSKPIPPEGVSPMPHIPAWVTRLTPDRVLMRNAGLSEKPDFQNTLIIGLGPAGREVLSQIALDLQGRFGENWPNSIRLLQIDVLPKDNPNTLHPPAYLRPGQWLLLRPDIKEIKKNLETGSDDWKHWRWFQNTEPDNERSQGRMAVFYDLNGSTSSLLKSIQIALTDLREPVVRVIGTTFDEVSSGMLVDICYLMHLYSTYRFDAQLWLCGPLGKDWTETLNGKARRLRPDDQITRSLATLREIERFQRNAPTPFIYVSPRHLQDKLRLVNSAGVVGSVFLFEPSSQAGAYEDDVLACMADCLLAVLNQKVHSDLAAHLTTNRDKAGDLVNSESLGVVSGMGSKSIRAAIRPIENALAWRMVRDGLYEAAVGLLPKERCNVSNGRYQELSQGERSNINSMTTVERMAQMNDLVLRLQRRLLTDEDFLNEVTGRVSKLLNGEPNAGNPLLLRRQGLVEAQTWLQSLTSMLKRNSISNFQRPIEDLREQLARYQRWLESAVYSQATAHLSDAQQSLERLRKQLPRDWVNIDETLEWMTYRKNMRSWNTPPSNNTGEPLFRLGARFGWDLQRQSGGHWVVSLLAMPPDFSWQEGLHLEEYIVKPENPEVLLAHLFAIALPLARVHLSASPLVNLTPEKVTQWLEAATPRLRYNITAAGEKMSGTVSTDLLLCAPRNAERDALQAAILGNPEINKERLKVSDTSDPASVTLLSATNWLPLGTIDLASTENWQLHPVMPSQYVFPGEQAAAQIEQEVAAHFSPRFVGYIAADQELLDLFTLGWIYEAFEMYKGRWDLPGLEPVHGNTPAQALKSMFELDPPSGLRTERNGVLKLWRQKIEACRSESTNRTSYLEDWDNNVLRPMSENMDHSEADFAAYARYLLQQEKSSI